MAHGDQKMRASDLRYSGWVKGWGVVEGNQPGWKFAGVFDSRQEAQTAAAQAGPGYAVRWGSYDERNKQFVSGNFA
jgi:hypothetical protein